MITGSQHIAPPITQDIIATVRYLKGRAGFPVKNSLNIIGLPSASYFRWAKEDGKSGRKESHTPKSHWILDWEAERVTLYKHEYPEVGYRRLAWMMVDADIVAISPSSVYRVLQRAGLSSRWTTPPGKKAHMKGFVQPTRPHSQWHSDISYLNILGTHYFFISILDGYSRSIIHHEVRTNMTTVDVEIVTERALEKLPEGTSSPRLITDNGSQYVSKEFQDYLRDRDISHSKARVNHPQSNGKIERFHKSLKEECVRVTAMTNLEEARKLIDAYVIEYNENRLHSALQYLTPADYLKGEEHVNRCIERRKEKLREAAKARRIAQNSPTGVT